MAITVSTSPAANVAAFATVTIAGTTTRNPFSAGVRLSNALTLIDNNGGFVRLTMASTTGYLAEDTVIIEGATGTFAQFNGRHEITSLTATTITLVTVWATATTGTYGTLYRMNENLYIKCEVLNGSAVVIGTLYNFVDTSTGGWTFNISKPLQYELASIFDMATTGAKATTLASHDYDIKLYEVWQAYDYSINELVHGTTLSTIAHRATELNSNVILTSDFYFTGKIFVHFHKQVPGAETYGIKFTESTGTETTTTAITLTNGHGAYVFEPAATAKWVKIEVWGISADEAVSAAVYAHKIGCASKILYYVNRFGGYEGYEFHNYTDEQKSIKVDKYAGEAWKERTLYGKEYINGTNQNIRDIVTSPEVYDDTYTLVQLTNDSLIYADEQVTPQVTIRIDETFIQ